MGENENVKIDDDTRWKVSIIRAKNGWIIEYWEEIEDDKWHKVERVFEDRDGEDDEKMSLIDALYEIVEYFGQGGSKHDAKRINIRYAK